MTEREKHDRMANAIRFLSMDAVEKANSGHPGLPMGAADIATVLFTRFLKYDATDPKWPDRDRFVLSAGHGSMLLYSLLYLTGYPDITLDEIKHFRQLGSRTAGHPEYGHAAGIETTTGPLGQGLANSVGMALGERIMNAAFGNDLVDHHTYVLAGDGCLMEGISQEAITLAGHLKLNKLIVIWDNNHISIDGAVSLADSTDQPKRASPLPAGTRRRSTAMTPRRSPSALEAARTSDRPTLIAAQNHDRFRRADQGRHQQGAWLAARRRGDRRRAQILRLGLPALRGARRHHRCLAGRRQGFGRQARRLAEASGRRRPASFVPNSSGASAASCRRISTRRSPTTRRSSPPTSRRSRPANHRRWPSRSSTAWCPRRSAARPT